MVLYTVLWDGIVIKNVIKQYFFEGKNINAPSTSSPNKQDIRHILEDEVLGKEFDMDDRKFSRNTELSFFSDKFGAGAMAESNLVFSSSSFVPRLVILISRAMVICFNANA